MIQKISLKNFRNFTDFETSLDNSLNMIIGENGVGKTNILEGISLLTSKTDILDISWENLLKRGEKNFFISGEFFDEKNNININVSISYSLDTNKKKYMVNQKSTTKQKFMDFSSKSVVFSPSTMNMLYMSPTLRRGFIDNLLSNSDNNYYKAIISYQNILKNRNKLLKNINEGKSDRNEINFWNSELIRSSQIIYSYRIKLTNYIKTNIKTFIEYFGENKIKNIDFKYDTKTNLEDIENSIKDYLEKNLERDIILKRTNIGPHLDDFSIITDGVDITSFASRGETKSVIIGLKMLEIEYIKNNTNIEPILLIDDLLSELDNTHFSTLLKKLQNYQTLISGIKEIDTETIYKKILL